MTQTFMQCLVRAYGGSGHDRVRSLTGRTIIRVDDLKRNDAPLRFCHISASFEGTEERCTLNLLNATVNAEVEDLVLSHNGRIINMRGTKHVHLPIGSGSAKLVRDLADAIRRALAVTPEQPRCKDPNCVWKCPRTAASLDRFAGHLERLQHAAQKCIPTGTTALADPNDQDIRLVCNRPADDRQSVRSL